MKTIGRVSYLEDFENRAIRRGYSKFSILLIIILIIILILPIIAEDAQAIDYNSDRMNYPPGVSRNHFQTISSVTGNLTATIPTGFNLTNYSAGGVVNANNITWTGLAGANINYTIASPSNCNENNLTQTDIYINGTLHASLPFICIPDYKITDFKVEYGHGCSNYLGIGDELFISNRSATLFNLARVFNLGYLLTPNEKPTDASLFCQYESLPVRTFGHGEVRRGANNINMTFTWQEISSGYWFRIGVLSQDFSARPVGTNYNVTCGNLTYSLGHTRVSAPFTNYSLGVRSEYPFIINRFNDTEDQTKQLFLIQNGERYTTHDLKIVFSQPNQTAIYEHPQLSPNQSLIFRINNASSTNVSVYFIASWWKHCTDPAVLLQSAYFIGSTGADAPPVLQNPGNQTAFVNVTFSLQMNGSDPLGRNISWQTNSTIFNVTQTGLIQFTPNDTIVRNHSIMVNVTGPTGFYVNVTFNMEIKFDGGGGTAHFPNITSHTPETPTTITAGNNQTFNITKTDPNNTTLRVIFTLDGTQVQTAQDPFPYQSDNFTYATNTSQAGETHNLTVNVSDNGNSTYFSWIINIVSNATAAQGASTGGGSRGIRYITTQTEKCEPEWECTPWTPCIGGEKRRTCRDTNKCAEKETPPAQSEECSTKPAIINLTFKPTCSDGILNQGEKGTDCGGPCERQCEAKPEAPAIERPGIINETCGDGKCNADETCACAKDCGLQVRCPQTIKTAMLALILSLLIFTAFFLMTNRNKAKT